MIVTEACTINVLLALTLASASVISYNRKGRSKLWHHSEDSIGVIYNTIMLKIQATGHTSNCKQRTFKKCKHLFEYQNFLLLSDIWWSKV